MKSLIKKALSNTPYRVVRACDANRFQAIDECLSALHGRGYIPNTIIDGGANIGSFACQMRKLFPNAVVHMIEPQPACFPALDALAREKGYILHKTALGSQQGTARLAIASEVTTGAYIAQEGFRPELETVVPIRRLDDLDIESAADDRTLLKLDLQGYELEALRGGETLLKSVEVVLCEVSFFAQAYEPPIAKLVSHLDERDFDLHDIASISARARDNRARQADLIFARRGSPVSRDTAWS